MRKFIMIWIGFWSFTGLVGGIGAIFSYASGNFSWIGPGRAAIQIIIGSIGVLSLFFLIKKHPAAANSSIIATIALGFFLVVTNLSVIFLVGNLVIGTACC